MEATLLAIHDKPFKGGSYFDRLFGKTVSKKPYQGVGPLHDVPHKQVNGLDRVMVKLEDRYDPMLVPLFKDLFEIIRMVLIPIAAELRQYAQVNATLLIQLEAEIAFYLGAADLIRRMEKRRPANAAARRHSQWKSANASSRESTTWCWRCG